MKLTVYQFAFSPYCIPITAVLKAVAVPFRAVEVPMHRRDEIIHLTRGRYYQVPVLVHGRKVVIESGTESFDVARYVDRVFAGRRLFPAAQEGLQQVLVRHIESELEAATFKIVDPYRIPNIADEIERVETVRHKERRFGMGCLDEWRRNRAKLLRRAEELLAPFDLMLRKNRFLLGDEPVYADFALFGILEALTYGEYVRIPRRLASLTRWRTRLARWKS